jgi:hypothetical protein
MEKASQPAPTPTKNMHQQLQADTMNHVTPLLSGQKRSLPGSSSLELPSSAVVNSPEPEQPIRSVISSLEPPTFSPVTKSLCEAYPRKSQHFLPSGDR